MNQLQDDCRTKVLRSVDQILLNVKKTRIKIGDSYFMVAASVLWNTLPCQINKDRSIDCSKSMIKKAFFGLKLVIMKYVLYIIYIYIYIYRRVEHAVLD